MPYCKVHDISAILGQQEYDIDSKPTYLEVESLIKNITAIMDSQFRSLGFTIPIIVDATSVELLKSICAFGGASLVERSSDAGIEKNHKADMYWQLFIAEMKRIKDNPRILDNSTKGNEQPPCISSYFIDDPTDTSNDARATMSKEF